MRVGEKVEEGGEEGGYGASMDEKKNGKTKWNKMTWLSMKRKKWKLKVEEKKKRKRREKQQKIRNERNDNSG